MLAPGSAGRSAPARLAGWSRQAGDIQQNAARLPWTSRSYCAHRPQRLGLLPPESQPARAVGRWLWLSAPPPVSAGPPAVLKIPCHQSALPFFLLSSDGPQNGKIQPLATGRLRPVLKPKRHFSRSAKSRFRIRPAADYAKIRPQSRITGLISSPPRSRHKSADNAQYRLMQRLQTHQNLAHQRLPGIDDPKADQPAGNHINHQRPKIECKHGINQNDDS